MHRLLLALPLAVFVGLKIGHIDSAPRSAEPSPTLVADSGAALPTQAEMDRLAKANPIATLEASLDRYKREVKGYTATFLKQDYTDGRLWPAEVTKIWFREKPFSVLMKWSSGTRRADCVLYVEGENKDQMLIRPSGRLARLVAGNVVARAVDGTDARSAGRYTLKEFGFKRTTERIVKEWRQLQKKGTLQVEYQGVKRLKEAGDRPCWTWRQQVQKPGEDRIAEVVVSIDTETWLQYGTLLKDEKGQLLGYYYFRDVKLNPKFKKGQFQSAALSP